MVFKNTYDDVKAQKIFYNNYPQQILFYELCNKSEFSVSRLALGSTQPPIK